MLRVVDCGARVLIPQSPEWQRIKNQIDSAMIFVWADFVSAHLLNSRKHFCKRIGAFRLLWGCLPSRIKRFWRPLAR